MHRAGAFERERLELVRFEMALFSCMNIKKLRIIGAGRRLSRSLVQEKVSPMMRSTHEIVRSQQLRQSRADGRRRGSGEGRNEGEVFDGKLPISLDIELKEVSADAVLCALMSLSSGNFLRHWIIQLHPPLF